jgi:nicotinate phosphoribosyltransferase
MLGVYAARVSYDSIDVSITKRRTRLASDVFDLPVDKIRLGYYTDAYFNSTKRVLELDQQFPRVLMQVFQRKHSVLGGMDETIAILRDCAGRFDADGNWQEGWSQLEVHALYDGDAIAPWETALTIDGDYSLFCHLETTFLGGLARRTLISTNVRRVVDAARGKPILYFPARHDHYRVQTGDGYAAHVAGAIGVSTDAQASWWGGRGLGTVPHGLIAAYGGDTVAAAEAFARSVNGDVNIVVLVDFDNDCVGTSLAVADALGPRLWGVRIDTSDTLVDQSLWPQMGTFDPRGVNPQLVRNVRGALDAAGYDWVRIVASGGFTAEKIDAFERALVPVDSYGVGSALIRGENDFTADVVFVNGEASGKRGRAFAPNPRLERVD